MTTLRKTITATAIIALIGGTTMATPASAWYRNNNGAAVVGALVGGLALGAAVGALASQPSYGYSPGYGYAPYRPVPAYGYGAGYGYGYGYGYAPRRHYHVDYYDDD